MICFLFSSSFSFVSGVCRCTELYLWVLGTVIHVKMGFLCIRVGILYFVFVL